MKSEVFHVRYIWRWCITEHLTLIKDIFDPDHSNIVRRFIVVLIIHSRKLKIMEMHILPKWQKVKVVRRAVMNMTATFTDFVNVHAMTELQDRL